MVPFAGTILFGLFSKKRWGKGGHGRKWSPQKKGLPDGGSPRLRSKGIIIV